MRLNRIVNVLQLYNNLINLELDYRSFFRMETK